MSNETKTEVATQEAKPLAPRQTLVVHDDGPVAHLMDTARFEHLYRIARVMAAASLTPAHMRGANPDETVGNCFRVCNQAIRWQFDPYAVVDETYVVKGKLGYQGKLVAAVINAKAGLKGGLRVTYSSGTGEDFAAVIYGSTGDIPTEAFDLLEQYANKESRPALNKLDALGVKAVRISVKAARTENLMWKNDPEQKLFYSGVTKWARRHKPEILLGVLTDDDLERIRDDEPAAGAPVGRMDLRANGAVSPPVTEHEKAPEAPPSDKPAEKPLATPEQVERLNNLASELKMTREAIHKMCADHGADRAVIATLTSAYDIFSHVPEDRAASLITMLSADVEDVRRQKADAQRKPGESGARTLSFP